MDSQRLRQFFHESREWARAETGLELFHQAARLLQTVASIDSGFFVYRKRIFQPSMTPQNARAYAGWGRFDDLGALDRLVAEGVQHPERFVPVFEQWISPDQLPLTLKDAWASYQFDRVGIWPLVSRERPVGTIVAARLASGSFPDDLTTVILDACAAQLSVALDLILAIRRSEEISQRDWLTGLCNRRGFHDRLNSVLDRAQGANRAVVIGVLDLDHLKVLNDTQGHPAGDDALRRVADILTRTVRADDVVARWGGDEFVVILSGVEVETEGVMERLRSAIMRQAPDLSVSVGGAVWGVDGETWAQCYAVADRRLYDAKRRRLEQSPSTLRGG